MWQSQAFPLSALIDSGANESFLDRGVVCYLLGLDTVSLDVNILNGKLLACVCERTIPVILHLPGNHQEKISFHN